MSAVDELEEQRGDEEPADYDIGFQDRLDMAGYESITEEEIFETKKTTVDQMWAWLEDVWRINRRDLG
jgi:hypothetical protein